MLIDGDYYYVDPSSKDKNVRAVRGQIKNGVFRISSIARYGSKDEDGNKITIEGPDTTCATAEDDAIAFHWHKMREYANRVYGPYYAFTGNRFSS